MVSQEGFLHSQSAWEGMPSPTSVVLRGRRCHIAELSRQSMSSPAGMGVSVKAVCWTKSCYANRHVKVHTGEGYICPKGQVTEVGQRQQNMRRHKSSRLGIRQVVAGCWQIYVLLESSLSPACVPALCCSTVQPCPVLL